MISAKIFRFVVSGGSATAVNLAILFVLTHIFKLWYIASAIVAFLFAFLISFFLQKFWTFKDGSRNTMHLQAFAFFIIVVVGIFINTSILYVLVERFSIHYLVAQIIGGVFVAILNFISYQKFIFHKI